MIDLENAKILLGSAADKAPDCNARWFYLTEYSDMEEFYKDVFEQLSVADRASVKLIEYSEIPEQLVEDNGIRANYFELQEQFEKMSGQQQEQFLSWCRWIGADLGKDDIYLLAERFSVINPTEIIEESAVEIPNELPYFNNTSAYERLAQQIFNDDYN